MSKWKQWLNRERKAREKSRWFASFMFLDKVNVIKDEFTWPTTVLVFQTGCLSGVARNLRNERKAFEMKNVCVSDIRVYLWLPDQCLHSDSRALWAHCFYYYQMSKTEAFPKIYFIHDLTLQLQLFLCMKCCFFSFLFRVWWVQYFNSQYVCAISADVCKSRWMMDVSSCTQATDLTMAWWSSDHGSLKMS